jgi:hypothetical protein
MYTELYDARAPRRPNRDPGGRLKVCQPNTKAVMNIAFDVRRNKYGSIDVNFYRNRGQHLRRDAIIELARSIHQYGLAWLRSWRKSRSIRA